MNISKNKIEEIIDGDDNIIGTNDRPEVSPDNETQASKTTDYNVKVKGQNFKNDFLGRFGFYFYESEGSDKTPIIEAIEGVVGESKALDVMGAMKPHIEEMLESYDTTMNEGKVVEDSIQPKKEDKLLSPDNKNNSDIIDKKMKKVADLLDKLSDSEIDKLITVLESKRSK